MIVQVLLFALTLIICSLFLKTKKNLLPGPWGIPLIGNFPVLYIDQCREMRKKYGDLFTTRLGAVSFLYIADFKLSKEAFAKLEFASRPDWQAFHYYEEEKRKGQTGGVIQRNGPPWHHSRRFLLRNLRKLGMGKSKLEDTIMGEVENLVEDFKSLTKEPSKLPFSINVSVLNVIWQLIASHRYKFSDQEVEKFMGKIFKVQEDVMILGVKEYFPFLTYILPKRLMDYIEGQGIFPKTLQDFRDMVQPFINKHLAKLDPNNPVDLIDEYLIEMKEKKSEELSHFSNDDLIRTTFDLFVAGNHPIATMVRWILFYMAKFPHIQKKIQDEIDKIVATDRLPGLEHRERLAYLDATINEVQRHCSLIPFELPRNTTADCTLNGFHIPKDIFVLSLSGISHRDPVYWDNPDEVDPSRFLDSNGKFIPSREGFYPFGLGKRQCLGETLARMELFLFVGALLQKFTFSAPEGSEIDITPRKFPLLMHRADENQKVCIKLRH